jgi:ABC-type glycerol-3-phosphate transport system substrate-binding protein
MIDSYRHSLVALALLTIVLSGCATGATADLDQRTTQGPTAEDVFTFRVATQNGREPTFEERRFWEDRVDHQISAYIREHPEVGNAVDITTFRFSRQATVGMTREQVTILLGQPDAVVTDPAAIEKLARKYWPMIRNEAAEAWVYPLGWRLYFSGPRLVDITQHVPRSLWGGRAE